MERFCDFIVEKRKWIIMLFAILSAVSLITSTFVRVNYNLMDYLPEDSPSTLALDKMNEEYKQAPPNARVMVPNVTVNQARAIKEKIEQIEGVQEVTWLDDSVNLYEPLEMMDQDTLESYYKNHTALFTLTIDEEETVAEAAIDQIQSIVGSEASMSGSIIDTVVSKQTTTSEIQLIMLFIIPIVFIILILTTTSWFEPVLFLGTIGVAILLNRGTNAFLGEISFVTNAAGSVLQLAVSMDYSIFLLHQFSACRKQEADVEKAMKEAIKISFSSVLSSGCTTVVGFIALILMRFRIGPDMGIVMAKAVVLSLIAVLVLLPAITLETYSLIDKTEHRLFFPDLSGMGKLAFRIRFFSIGMFVLTILPCYLAQGNNIFLYGSSGIFNDESTKVGRDKIVINEAFGESNPFVLMVPKGDLEKETRLSEELRNQEYIRAVVSYSNTVGNEIPSEFVPKEELEKLFSKHYSRFILTVDGNDVDGSSFMALEKIKEIAKKYYGEESMVAGNSPSTYDLKQVSIEDTASVNTVAIGAIFLILIFNFKSISLPIILTLVIEVSIWMNLTFPYFANVQLNYIAYLIISSVQLGATIDYAILLTSHYMENRQSMKKKEAAMKTIKETYLSIFTSGSILTLSGICLSLICTNGVLKQLGTLVGRGAVISVLLVLFVLPILLVWFDRIIAATTRDSKFYLLEIPRRRAKLFIQREIEKIKDKIVVLKQGFCIHDRKE